MPLDQPDSRAAQSTAYQIGRIADLTGVRQINRMLVPTNDA